MVSSEDSSDTYSTEACIRGVCVLFACALLSYLDLLALLRPATHRTEYVGVKVQNLAYLGFRPTEGLSAEFERWAMLCRITLVGCILIRCTPPWRSERVVSHQCTPAGKIDLSIAVSTVTGRFMLMPDLTTTNYYY